MAIAAVIIGVLEVVCLGLCCARSNGKRKSRRRERDVERLSRPDTETEMVRSRVRVKSWETVRTWNRNSSRERIVSGPGINQEQTQMERSRSDGKEGNERSSRSPSIARARRSDPRMIVSEDVRPISLTYRVVRSAVRVQHPLTAAQTTTNYSPKTNSPPDPIIRDFAVPGGALAGAYGSSVVDKSRARLPQTGYLVTRASNCGIPDN
jgi:hypothetical protein